jgi:hypothetical protein
VDEIRLAQAHHVTMIPERIVEGMSEDGVSLRLRHTPANRRSMMFCMPTLS